MPSHGAFQSSSGTKIKREIKGSQIATEPAHGSEHLLIVAAVVFRSSGHSEEDGQREKEREGKSTDRMLTRLPGE